MIFSNSFCKVPELLEGQTNKGDIGWVAVVLPQPEGAPGKLSLDEAWNNENFSASFIFNSFRPPLSSEEDARLIVKLVHENLSTLGACRGIFWLSKDLNHDGSWPSLGFNKEAKEVSYALNVSIGSFNFEFKLDNGMLTYLSDETLYFENKKGGDYYIHFSGLEEPFENVSKGKIAFSGPELGCIAFKTNISPKLLHKELFWGFQFQVPNFHKDANDSFLTEWAPFAEPELVKNGYGLISFSCVFDPSDIFNRTLDRRTLFKFTGQSLINSSSKDTYEKQRTSLKSYFRTTTGAEVTLYPVGTEQTKPSDVIAALVFARGRHLGENKLDTYVTPVGDFVVSAPTAPSSKRSQIMCGLQGNEFISLEPVSEGYEGGRLRFIGCQPSFGYCYPLREASPVGPPVILNGQILDKTFTTSWVTIVSAQDASQKPIYAAQPNGAPLYGQDPIINQKFEHLLGTMHPGTEFSEKSCFPMIPYAGISKGDGLFTFSSELIGLFERQFLSPTRRAIIGTGKSVPCALDHQPRFLSAMTEFNITTPSGWLVTINEQGDWVKILLAQLIPQSKESQHSKNGQTELSFAYPCPKLKQVFQTADPMLVIANPKLLGTMNSNKILNGPESAFNHTLNLENWILTVQVGENCSYGDYSNVIIVKGVKGKLFDPANTNESLVANPAKWTQKEDFAVPSGNVNELVPLSHWLVNYFNDAAKKTGSEALYFEKFNRIAQDENWTGILVLRADIEKIPEQLKGIVVGINDPSLFHAHHLAIETGQISLENGVNLKDSTSIYGLIYYIDPAYDTSKPEQPIPPAAGEDYDFRLLTLKVLFENSSIKNFQSYAQLTLNKLFGSHVTSMVDGNIFNSIILCGTLHEHDRAPVYALGSLEKHAYTFLVDNNVLKKIGITSVQMNTRQATDYTKVWFGLTGYMDFATLINPKSDSKADQKDPEKGVDLFSFGSSDNENNPRPGLHFSNLGLAMNYPTDKPQDRKFDFNTDEIRFDLNSSTIREDSLYRSFALELEDLITGKGQDNTPSKKGFLNVITDFTDFNQVRLSGVGDKETWYGLKFRLKLGTPGELAGKIGLNADLLLAWSSQSGKANDYKVEIGLHMPGASNDANLISIQGILKLSYGPLKLIYAKNPKSSSGRCFMLLLTDVALKFLGLMKIPQNSSTCFYLFGNPESKGEASGLGWYAMYKKDKK